ncbi:MAG: hypothetical protein KDE31_22010, partial [Caldilineaceae bacterium]|nr:hypothetical protein [Caldilineaceae bacterium]
MRRRYAEALTTAGTVAPYLAHETMLNLTNLSVTEWRSAVAYIFGVQGGLGYQTDFDFTPAGLRELEASLNNKWIRSVSTNRTLTGARLLTSITVLMGVGVGLILTNIKGGETPGQILLATMKAVSTTVQAVTTFRNVAANIGSVTNATASAINTATLQFSFTLNSAAGKAAAVGAVIGIVATWALFFAAWGKSGISTDSIEFNNLLAGAIAGTLVVLFNVLLSLSVVGLIIQAVFAIFDLFALIACKAGAKTACDIGITESITKVITDWIYTGEVMIDTAGDPPITSLLDTKMQLTDSARGMVVGNSVRFAVTVRSEPSHAAPKPGVIYHYPNFYTPSDLQSTTVQYTLTRQESKFTPNLNQMEWPRPYPYAFVTTLAPSPVIGWLAPSPQTKYLYQTATDTTLTSEVYAFTAPAINQTFPLYLNTGMALPRYDCWFQVCVHKSIKTATSTDLGKQFVLDILPTTLDAFVNWNALGTQIDLDGDGLGVTIDPNLTTWDADSDGVPDGKEYTVGSSQSKADSDDDGLSDAQ